MKGHLLLADHITIGINGMFNALNAGFTHIHVPAAHPPNELYQHRCSILLGFRAEGGEDKGQFPFRLMLEHIEYDPLLIWNGTATVPAIGNIYAVLPGTFMLRYPTSYTLCLYIERKGEPELIADLGFTVARIASRPEQQGMSPFGAQPGVPPGVVLGPRAADVLDPPDGEGAEDSDDAVADYDPSDDIEGIDWPEGDDGPP